MAAYLVLGPSTGVFRNVFNLLYLHDRHQYVFGKSSAQVQAHLIPSPSSGIIHKAIPSVVISAVSIVDILIVLHNGRFAVISATSIAILIDDGVLNICIIAATIVVAVFVVLVDDGFVSTAVSTTVAIIVVDKGLILDDCVPATAAIIISTVPTTLFISMMTAAVEVIFELILVSLPMLLYVKTTESAMIPWRRVQG